jgi:hypothetical protein
MPDQELEHGRTIFNNLRDDLYGKVCVDWEFCKRRHDPDLSDTVNLGAALIDVIAALSIGFPPALISTILIKKGLTKFCDCKNDV